MQQENDIPAAIDYAGTGETRTQDGDLSDDSTTENGRAEPGVLVELVVVDGPEGRRLHEVQAEVIYRILVRMAEKQMQTPQKESRL